MEKTTEMSRHLYDVANSLKSALCLQARTAILSVLKDNKGKQFRYTENPLKITDPYADTEKPVSVNRVWYDEDLVHVEYYKLGRELDYAPITRISTEDILRILDTMYQTPKPTTPMGIWEELTKTSWNSYS